MTPHEFIAKWRPVTLSEMSAYQQHFLDLCDLFGVEKPAAADPTGAWFTFQKGLTTTADRKGVRGRVAAGLLRVGVQGQAQELERGVPAAPEVPGGAGEPAAA